MGDDRADPPAVHLQRLAAAGQELALLAAADGLGLFAAIRDGADTAEALAERLGGPPQGIERVCRALVGLEYLLPGEHGAWRLGERSVQCLLPDGPGYAGDLVRFLAEHLGAFLQLPDAVRAGGPLLPHDGATLIHRDDEDIRRYVRGLYSIAQGTGRVLAAMLDLSACRTLLDVAGGSGAYSILFCAANPNLRATVFELAPVLRETRQFIARHDMIDRIATRPGDYHTDDFGRGFDVVFFSHVFQTEGEAVGRMLLRKAFEALEPGGRLIVHGMMANPDGTSPRALALFGVLMYLLFPEGAPHAPQTLQAWAEDAGFAVVEAVRDLPPPVPSRVLCMRKPG